ncbi:MAG: Ig-like domain-containing protein [Muribaculaceae bacterium]|nr:Ig-like domain-containing protein [Muribaculaceae bacterium]
MFREWKYRDGVIGLAVIVLAAVGMSCARIGTPSGGRRDEMPPQMTKAHPEPNSRNFAGHRVVLDFDEFVNVKDAMTNVVISPPGETTPRVTSQGRHVYVNFQDTLLSNTTYTIDFGSAIEDNNEGNVLENFSYTFSTGDDLDTLRIAGMVLSSDGLEPMQRKLVGVHRNHADSAFIKMRFDRMARTDDRGRFSIEGLSPGEYRVFAIDDADGNLRYSSPEEEIAFYEVLVTPSVTETETIDSIYNLRSERLDTIVKRVRPLYLPNDLLLRSFVTDRKQQYIASYTRVDSTRLDIRMGAAGKTMPKFSLVGAPELDDWYVCEHSATNDTISLWLTRPSIIRSDTLRVSVSYEKLDSLSNYVSMTDTLRFLTDRPRVRKNDNKKKKVEVDTVPPPTVFMMVSNLSGSILDYGKPIVFETQVPLARLDTAGFHLEERRDSLWVPMSPPLPELVDTLNPRRYKVDVPAVYGKEMRLVIDSVALSGINGLHNNRQELQVKVRTRDEYSSLKVNLSGMPAGVPAFVELLQSADVISRRVTVKDGVAIFENLLPGKYYMRLYLDYNGNGRYDTGDYHLQRQPEQVFYYPKQVTIKQNWEKEESWNILATAMDQQKPRALLKNRPTLKRGEKEQPVNDDEEEEENFYSSGSRGMSTSGNGMSGGSSRLRGL